MSNKKYVVVRQPSSQRQPYPDKTTGLVNAFDFMIAIAVVGLVFFLLDDPMNIIHSSISGFPNIAWARYIWATCLIFFLVFGSFSFLTSLRENNGGR